MKWLTPARKQDAVNRTGEALKGGTACRSRKHHLNPKWECCTGFHTREGEASLRLGNYKPFSHKTVSSNDGKALVMCGKVVF